MLAKAFDLVHISVGDIFRWHIQSHTKLAAASAALTANGELVSDDIVEEVVKGRLDQHDWNFGSSSMVSRRNGHQAEFFLESYDIDAVILIDGAGPGRAPRILNRRLCSKCGLDSQPDFSTGPWRPMPATSAAARWLSRADDTPAVVAHRLKDYHAKTAPIIELFRRNWN